MLLAKITIFPLVERIFVPQVSTNAATNQFHQIVCPYFNMAQIPSFVQC